MIYPESMIKSKNKLLLPSLLLLTLVYFASRLQNLITLPIFGDEAIYVRWSQVIQNVETLRFIPLTDGKQPFFMWLTIPFFKIFTDPLYASRFVSVISGFKICFLLYLTSCLILNYYSKTKTLDAFIKESLVKNFPFTLIAPTIYVLLPFTFFFDRMALADTLLSTFGLASLLLSLLLSKFKRFDLSLLLGLTLGLAWITKSPAIYFITLSLATFLIFNLKNLRSFILPLGSALISFLIYNTLRLGPQFHMIALRNRDYVWSVSEILAHPLDPLKPHLIDIFSIFSHYISLPFIVFVILLAFFLIKKKLNLIHLVLLSWFILPLFANAVFAKVFTARYILYTIPAFILLFSYLLADIFLKYKNKLFLPLLTLFFLPGIIWIIGISTAPFDQNIPPTESGYLNDWTSGWGVKESSVFLINRSKEANVIVGTEGAFGTLPNGLQIYTQNVDNLTVIGQGLGFTHIPESLLNAKEFGDEVYLLINQSRLLLLPEEKSKLKLIQQYPKPDGDYLELYQL